MNTKVVFLILATILALLALVLLAPSLVSDAGAAGPDCRIVPIPEWGNGQTIHEVWDAAPEGVACLIVEWVKPGTVLMSGGVFTAPLYLNGNVLPTQFVEGQLAPQIMQFQREVSVAGETWEFRPTWQETGTELYLGFDYNPLPAPVHLIYLPFISNAPSVEESRTILPSASGEVRVIQANWLNASRGQQACLNLMFVGSAGDARLESGWFFGTNLQTTLNGEPFTIPTSTRPGESATQIGNVALSNAQALRVCVVADTGGTEIGLRIRYPS